MYDVSVSGSAARVMYWKNACAIPSDMAPVNIQPQAMSRMTAWQMRERKRMSGLTALVKKSLFRAATRTLSVYSETFSKLSGSWLYALMTSRPV